uniref:Invertebrate defensins family profile domain-containing protein n=1 Tax=Anopheles epiroticus TaxID=199890 RepID=A0A2C9GVP0_9DIPT
MKLLSFTLVLLVALIGLFATVAVGQTPCSSSARVRCNIHCRGYNKQGNCVNDSCSCIEKSGRLG